MQKLLISIIASSALLGGCSNFSMSDMSMPDLKMPESVPDLVHKVDIQQGNIINQDMINKLEPGMSQRQVRFIMGSPMISDTFHAGRWDYLYRMHKSGHAPSETKRVSLYFDNNQLTRIEGDIRPLPVEEDATEKKIQVVEVPVQDRNEGFVDKTLTVLRLKKKEE
jgi:outer membrane protein assembly factor BamE